MSETLTPSRCDLIFAQPVESFEMPVGLPRPIYDNRPVPWSAEVDGGAGGSTSVVWRVANPNRRTAVRDENRCAVCGEAVGDVCTVISLRDLYRITDGMIMHERCGQLALRHCPHFEDHELSIGPTSEVLWTGTYEARTRAGFFDVIAKRSGATITRFPRPTETAVHAVGTMPTVTG